MSGTYAIGGGEQYKTGHCQRVAGDGRFETSVVHLPVKFEDLTDWGSQSLYNGSGPELDGLLKIEQTGCHDVTLRARQLNRDEHPLNGSLNEKAFLQFKVGKKLTRPVRYQRPWGKGKNEAKREIFWETSNKLVFDDHFKSGENCRPLPWPARGKQCFDPPNPFKKWIFQKTREGDLVVDMITAKAGKHVYRCHFTKVSEETFNYSAVTVPRLPMKVRSQGYPFTFDPMFMTQDFSLSDIRFRFRSDRPEVMEAIIDDEYNAKVEAPMTNDNSLYMIYYANKLTPTLFEITDLTGKRVFSKVLSQVSSSTSIKKSFLKERVPLSDLIDDGILQRGKSYLYQTYRKPINKRVGPTLNLDNEFELAFQVKYENEMLANEVVVLAQKSYLKNNNKLASSFEELGVSAPETFEEYEYDLRVREDGELFVMFVQPKNPLLGKNDKTMAMVNRNGDVLYCNEQVPVMSFGSYYDLAQYDANNLRCPKDFRHDSPEYSRHWTEETVYFTLVDEKTGKEHRIWKRFRRGKGFIKLSLNEFRAKPGKYQVMVGTENVGLDKFSVNGKEYRTQDVLVGTDPYRRPFVLNIPR